MNTSRLLLGAIVVCALPSFAQPEQKPANDLPYPLISLEEAALLAETKPIKLHLRDVTVRDALKEIERQTGILIDTATPVNGGNEYLDKKLSVDIETSSLPEASDAIFDEADIKATLSLSDNTGTWRVTAKSNAFDVQDGPLTGTAPFQVRALRASVHVSKDIFYGKKRPTSPNQSNNFTLSLGLVTPPQMPFLATTQVKVTRADDDQGRSLILKNDMDPFRFVMARSSRQVNVSLQPPQSTSRALAHLEGTIVCLLAKQYKTWETPDVINAKETTQQFNTGWERVSLSVKPTVLADSIILDIQATAPGGEFQNMGVPGIRNPLLDVSQYNSMVRLVDANGQMLQSIGAGGSSNNQGAKIQMNFRYPPRPFVPFEMKEGQMVPVPPPPPTPPTPLVGPFKLIIKAPSDIVQTEVPFSFSNLPLP